MSDRAKAGRGRTPGRENRNGLRGADPRGTVVNTVMLAALTAVAAGTFWPIYRTEWMLLVVAAAIVLGSAIAILGARFSWRAWQLGCATIGAYLAFGVPLAVPDRALGGVLPTVPGLLDLIVGTALSWKQLLTIALPVGSYQTLLIPLYLLALLSSVVGLSLALRAPVGEAGAVAPAAMFGTGVLFGPPFAAQGRELALGFLVLTLAWLIWRRQRRRRGEARLLSGRATAGSRSERTLLAARAFLASTIILVLAVGGAITATALAPVSSDRQVLRSSIDQPFRARDYPSPLAGFRAYLQPSAADEPMLTVTGIDAGSRVRIATLDSYDGVVYRLGGASGGSASGSFTRVPYRIDQSTAAATAVDVQVTINAYTGVWVPTVGRLQSLRFSGADQDALENSFYYNDTSSTAADPAGLARGGSYHLLAVVPDSSVDFLGAADSSLSARLQRLQPGSAPVPGAQVVPQGIDEALANYTEGTASPGEALAAMLAGLKADGYVSHGLGQEPFSRSGHGADRITELLRDEPMIGDAEQYAVAAALMASRIGFPSRVVMGFEAPVGAAPEVPVVLTGSDVTAWIEVNVSGLGWVALDPNPSPREVPKGQPEDPTEVARPRSVVPPPAEERTEITEPVTPDVSEDEDVADQPGWLAMLLSVLRGLGWGALVAAILTAPFLTVLAAKARRRRLRRRSGSPLSRVEGGWQEFADAALDHGYAPPPLPTRTELASTVGGMPSLILASVVDRATFSPKAPTDGDAASVWQAVDELRGSLSESRTRWERVKAAVSVRSFRSARQRRLTVGPESASSPRRAAR